MIWVNRDFDMGYDGVYQNNYKERLLFNCLDSKQLVLKDQPNNMFSLEALGEVLWKK